MLTKRNKGLEDCWTISIHSCGIKYYNRNRKFQLRDQQWASKELTAASEAHDDVTFLDGVKIATAEVQVAPGRVKHGLVHVEKELRRRTAWRGARWTTGESQQAENLVFHLASFAESQRPCHFRTVHAVIHIETWKRSARERRKQQQHHPRLHSDDWEVSCCGDRSAAGARDHGRSYAFSSEISVRLHLWRKWELSKESLRVRLLCAITILSLY